MGSGNSADQAVFDAVARHLLTLTTRADRRDAVHRASDAGPSGIDRQSGRAFDRSRRDRPADFVRHRLPALLPAVSPELLRTLQRAVDHCETRAERTRMLREIAEAHGLDDRVVDGTLRADHGHGFGALDAFGLCALAVVVLVVGVVFVWS